MQKNIFARICAQQLHFAIFDFSTEQNPKPPGSCYFSESLTNDLYQYLKIIARFV